jgi:hypothetical protein
MTAKWVRMWVKSKSWWNAAIKERRNTVGRENRRRPNSDVATMVKAAHQKSTQQSKRKM